MFIKKSKKIDDQSPTCKWQWTGANGRLQISTVLYQTSRD
jgi:hypothetical protein